MRRAIAVVKMLGVVVAAGIIGVPQIVATAVHTPTARRIPKLWHKSMLGLVQMKVISKGEPLRDEPVVFISNHASYIDVIVLGSLIEGCFVAKSEVAGWPFFGWLAKVGRTVFVERERRSTAGEQRDTLVDHLREGDNVIFFPEGTSNNGQHIERFKSTLLAAAEHPVVGDEPARVQPIAIAYTGIHGLPMGRRALPKFAWYGDMELLPHLYELMQVGPCEVQVIFLEPVSIKDFKSRKDLAAHCQSVISSKMGDMLHSKA